MNQATRPEVGSFFFLMTLVGVCGAAGQQSSCKGQVIQEMPKPSGKPRPGQGPACSCLRSRRFDASGGFFLG